MLTIDKFIETTKNSSTTSFDTADNIAQNFFLVDHNNKNILEDEEVLKELLRRVTIFHDALEHSKNIYNAFSNAYKGTLHKIGRTKSQYIERIAKEFVSLLLFGNYDGKLENTEDIVYVKNRLDLLLGNSNNETTKEIIQKLHHMIKKGYARLHHHRVGMLNELQNELGKIAFFLYKLNEGELETNSIEDLNSLLFDLIQIKRNYKELAYPFMEKWAHTESYDLFCEQLDKGINLIPYMQQIQADEQNLANQISEVLYSDTYEIKETTTIDDIMKQHMQKHNVFVENRRKKYQENDHEQDEQLTGESYLLSYGKLYYKSPGGELIFSSFLENTINENSRYKKIKYFDSFVGRANYPQIIQDKEKVGAKGAYLNEITKFLKKFQKYRKTRSDFTLNNFYEQCAVPSYENISQNYYDKRKESKQLDNTYFQKVYKNRKDKESFIVRSSAINSEDNEINTGAGIYHSEPVIENNTYETFCKAIEKVYLSCDSERAIQYRKDNNIETESMGLVIQEYIGGYNAKPGYSNSIMPHRPELSTLALENKPSIKPIFDKNKIDESLFAKPKIREEKSIGYYELDTNKFDTDERMMINNIAYVTYLLETYFQKPIQAEFVFAEKQSYDTDQHGYKIYKRPETCINIVQVRPLPQGLSEKHTIVFPKNKKSLREGRALGVCNKEYNVLKTGDYNNDQVGVVIFSDNQYASLHESFIERSIPKEGVVIVKNYAGHTGYNGHIETLCMERGIVCLFPDPEKGGYSGFSQRITIRYGDFDGYKKVKIVADGLSGKVYGVGKRQEDSD